MPGSRVRGRARGSPRALNEVLEVGGGSGPMARELPQRRRAATQALKNAPPPVEARTDSASSDVSPDDLLNHVVDVRADDVRLRTDRAQHRAGTGDKGGLASSGERAADIPGV